MAFTRTIPQPVHAPAVKFTISKENFLALQFSVSLTCKRVEDVTQGDLDTLHNLFACILYDADRLEPAPMTQEDADIVEHACNG